MFKTKDQLTIQRQIKEEKDRECPSIIYQKINTPGIMSMLSHKLYNIEKISHPLLSIVLQCPEKTGARNKGGTEPNPKWVALT